MSFSFGQLQQEHAEWGARNFPGQRGQRAFKQPGILEFIGAVEELGELAHSILKMEQGIRGTDEEHDAAARDAVADVTVFLAAYCTARGWSYGEIVEKVWSQVRQRNWRMNPVTGAA